MRAHAVQDAIEVIKTEQETKRSLAGRVQELEAQLAVDPSEREAQLTSALEEVHLPILPAPGQACASPSPPPPLSLSHPTLGLFLQAAAKCASVQLQAARVTLLRRPFSHLLICCDALRIRCKASASRPA